MFNLLVTADPTAWESGQRMSMMASRFGEFSGDSRQAISLDDLDSLKTLERVQSLLMYETTVADAHADFVRVGQLHDIRVGGGRISFRFTESGRLSRDVILNSRHRLQVSDWELNRTHWAIKDGEIPQDVLAMVQPTPMQYDVVLSFAGEDRLYVEHVADFLNRSGVLVFYDRYEQVTLWGKDLAEHFESIYRKQARFCVMFISRYYADKVWTRHERHAALARAMAERTEYVLPVRFDHAEIPGLRPTIGYLDLRTLSPEQLGAMILQKLGRR